MAVDGESVGLVELRQDRPAPVARRPDRPGPGHGVDVSGGHGDPVEGAVPGRHHPDGGIARVADHEVAGGVQGEAGRIGQFGRRCRPAVAAVSPGAVARHGGDGPGGDRLAEPGTTGGGHHADPVVLVVGQVHVAGTVGHESVRRVARGIGGRAPVPPVAGRGDVAGARHRGLRAGRGEGPDDHGRPVADVEGARVGGPQRHRVLRDRRARAHPGASDGGRHAGPAGRGGRGGRGTGGGRDGAHDDRRRQYHRPPPAVGPPRTHRSDVHGPGSRRVEARPAEVSLHAPPSHLRFPTSGHSA